MSVVPADLPLPINNTPLEWCKGCVPRYEIFTQLPLNKHLELFQMNLSRTFMFCVRKTLIMSEISQGDFLVRTVFNIPVKTSDFLLMFFIKRDDGVTRAGSYSSMLNPFLCFPL